MSEAPNTVLVVRNLCQQYLQRDLPLELGVLGKIHLTHPARTESRDYLVMQNFFAVSQHYYFEDYNIETKDFSPIWVLRHQIRKPVFVLVRKR